MDAPDISTKIKSAIKAKLCELEAYVDDELPDYIMVMVANKKTQKQMQNDLEIFLHQHTTVFTKWLFVVLDKLKRVTKVKKSGVKSDKKDKKEKVKKIKKTGEVKEKSSKKAATHATADGENQLPSTDKKKTAVGEGQVTSEKKKTTVSADGSKPEKKKKEKKKKVKEITSAVASNSGVISQPKSDGKPKPSFATTKSVKVKPDDEQQQPPDKPVTEESRVRKESEGRAKSPAKQKPETSTEEKDRKTESADSNKKAALKEHTKNVQKSKSGERTKSESKDLEKTDKKVRHDSASLDEFSSPSPIDRKRHFSSPNRKDRHANSSDTRRRDRSRSPLLSTVQRVSDSSNRQRSLERPQDMRHRSLDRPQYERHRSLERSNNPRQPFYQQRRSPERRGVYDLSRSYLRMSRSPQNRGPRPRSPPRGQNRGPRSRSPGQYRNQRDDYKRKASPERRRERTTSNRRDSSGERSRPALMSSVGAVVNHESDDEYNPIRMLKTSIASTVQVARPKPSASEYGSSAQSRMRPAEPASKSLVLRAVKEADNSIKQKQREEEEREAQLDEIRKKREQKLAILRSKGIGGKKAKQTRDDTHKNSAIERDALNIKSDVRKKERVDDLRKRNAATAREERNIKRVSFSEDLDEELDEEELKLIKNKKNFVIEIKNRSSTSVIKGKDEDLRLRLEKRRHVVHRHMSHDEIVDSNDNRRLPTAEAYDSPPPMKIVKIEEPQIEEQEVDRMEEDKDLMEMRRRALESMARGRLQQTQPQSEKKIIVPLNEDSSSDSSSDDSSSDSSSDDDDDSSSDISLTSTDNEAEKNKAQKDGPTFVVTLDGIDSAYFKDKARPSQTNSKLILMQNRYKKDEEDPDSPNKQDRGIDEPIVLEQRKNISVPVLAAVGGGSGRTDPKNNDSVYRAATTKKPEAKVAPLKPTSPQAVTVKQEKNEEHKSSKVEPSQTEKDSNKNVAPQKVRKRIEAPDKTGEPTRPLVKAVEYARPVHKPAGHISRAGPGPVSKLGQCRFWPHCKLGEQCLFYHPPPSRATARVSRISPVALSAADKYRWTSANAPI